MVRRARKGRMKMTVVLMMMATPIQIMVATPLMFQQLLQVNIVIKPIMTRGERRTKGHV
jgi:accessory gene regulator protein AgrB